MRALSWTAVGVLWLREMKRFVRARTRLVGTLIMPVFLYLFLGAGLGRSLATGTSYDVGYATYLLPGILGMSLLLSSTFTGISVLWDREFGFLKEIMVAPVSRLSLVLGRIAGGVTTALVQVAIIIVVALVTGYRPGTDPLVLPAVAIVVLVAIGFIGLGLLFASIMTDIQGFNLVMGFVIFPMLMFSGALFPLADAPWLLRAGSLLDPLTYGVDGLRACLQGHSDFSLAVDLIVVSAFSAVTVGAGVLLFERQEIT